MVAPAAFILLAAWLVVYVGWLRAPLHRLLARKLGL